MNKYYEYLIGAIQGDGSFTFNYYKGKKTPSSIRITIGIDDSEYAKVIFNIMKLAFPDKTPKIYNLPSSKRILTVSLFDTNLAKEFQSYKKDGIWSIPDLKFPEWYIAGLWDTDGYVGNNIRNKLQLRIKKSGNLKHALKIFENLKFKNIKFNCRKYTNKLGTFEQEGIFIHNKIDSLNFAKLIPLQHPRKQKELNLKVEMYLKTKTKRCHGELSQIIIDYLKKNPNSNSKNIALNIGKKRASDITKELKIYTEKGLIKRNQIGKKLIYFV